MSDLLITYEHKAREYQYFSLIKYEMKRRGYSVNMCHYSFRNHWIYQIFDKPKVVLGPWGHSNLMFPNESTVTMVEWVMDTLRGRANYYINMQMEQVFRSDKANFNVNIHTQENTFNICWGPLRKQQLMDIGFQEDKLLLTGAVQLDCLRPELEGFYRSKDKLAAEYGLDPKKKWILFISGFVFASKSVSMMKHEATQLIKGGANISVNDILRDREISILTQKTLMEWIAQYLADEDVIFIYRPHPGEHEVEAVRKVRLAYPQNFYNIKEESVQQWIVAADFVMLWNSTAVAEVYAARKACCIVQPFPLSANMQPVIMEHSNRIVDTYDCFRKELNGAWEFSKETFPVDSKELEKYYLFDKKLAYLKICDYIEQILKLPKPNNEKSKFTWKVLTSKQYLRFRYMDFYSLTHIRLSKIIPIKRKMFADAEQAYNSSRTKMDVELTRLERAIFSKTKNYVNKIARLGGV